MAIIRNLKRNQELGTSFSSQKEALAECKIAMDEDGNKYIQICTMGSAEREIPGKQSQNLLLTRETFIQIKDLISEIEAIENDQTHKTRLA